VHEVRIRSQSGAARLPQELKNHPLGPEIKKAATKAILDWLHQRLAAHRKAKGFATLANRTVVRL
jgi:hypothetical protein